MFGKLTKESMLICLISVNTALLVASNAGGAKMIEVFGGLSASATVFSYAISFVITDAISEIYGTEKAKLTVRIGFLGLILSVAFFSLSIAAPSASYWKGQSAYEQTLMLGPRLLAGGWISYMVSQNLDVWIFHKVRAVTNGRHLWLRNNVSTLVSQFVDTCLFITIAFYGMFPIGNVILGQYLIKVIIALIDTPIVYAVVSYSKRIKE